MRANDDCHGRLNEGNAVVDRFYRQHADLQPRDLPRRTTASSLAQVATTTGTDYTDISLPAMTTYYYAVQTTDSAADVSTLSTVVPVTTLPLPRSNTVTATPCRIRKIELQGTSPSGVTVASYSVFRGTSPSSLAQIASVTTLKYWDTGLTALTTYYYAEQAVTSSGPLPISPTVSATTYEVPTKPVLALTVASFSEIDLSWTAWAASVPIDHYNIYRGLTSTTSALLTTGSTKATPTPA